MGVYADSNQRLLRGQGYTHRLATGHYKCINAVVDGTTTTLSLHLDFAPHVGLADRGQDKSRELFILPLHNDVTLPIISSASSVQLKLVWLITLAVRGSIWSS